MCVWFSEAQIKTPEMKTNSWDPILFLHMKITLTKEWNSLGNKSILFLFLFSFFIFYWISIHFISLQKEKTNNTQIEMFYMKKKNTILFYLRWQTKIGDQRAVRMKNGRKKNISNSNVYCYHLNHIRFVEIVIFINKITT